MPPPLLDASAPYTLRTTLKQVVLILVLFVLSWKASALFEVATNVSALYFTGGVSFAVAVFFGWRHLPTAYLVLVLMQTLGAQSLEIHSIDWIGPVRQTAIYGAAGLYMRHIWLTNTFRLSQAVALRFLVTAFASSMLSALGMLKIKPGGAIPDDQLTHIFFSFWGGDFAGVMVTVPILVTLYHVIARAQGKAGARWLSLMLRRLAWRDALWLSAIAVGTSLFTIWMPRLLASDVRLDVMVLLPVLLAGLWRGALAGFLVATLVSLLEIFARPYLGMPSGLTFDLQLLIVMNAAVALLAGAAHDDQRYEWQRANFDALTGLANRSCFEDRLSLEFKRSFRSGQPFALLYLDLDGFKKVNDTLGHRSGDELLRLTGQRLLACVRQTDTVARLGGDEFAIILSEVGDSAIVQGLASTMVEAVSRPFSLGGQVVHVSASIGIAYSLQHGVSPIALMHSADQAMYNAKALGKNRFMTAPATKSAGMSFS